MPRPRRAHLTIATFAAAAAATHALNFGFNVVMLALLGPAAYAEVALVIALWLATTFVASTLQLQTAGAVAAYAGTAERSAARARSLRHARTVGFAATAVWLIGAPAVGWLTHATTLLPFVVVGAGMPWMMRQAVERGVAQGSGRYELVAASLLTEAATRMAVGVGVVLIGGGVTAAACGLLASFVSGGWIVSRLLGPVRQHAAGDAAPIAAAAAAPAGIVLVTIAEVVLSYVDLLVVRSAFSAESAGLYAAVALVGRGAFAAAWPLVQIAYPTAVKGRTSVADRHRAVLLVVAPPVLVCGVLAVMLLTLGRVPAELLGLPASALGLAILYLVSACLLSWGLGLTLLLLGAGDAQAPRRAAIVAGICGATLIAHHPTLERVVVVQIVVVSAWLAYELTRHLTRRAARRVDGPVLVDA